MRLIFAILGLCIAGGIFLFFTKPTYDSMQSDQTQVTQYNAALDKAAELQQLKQTLLSRYNAFAPNDLDRLQKMLPDHVDNIALILDLDNLASHYNLALENVQVSAPSTQGTGDVGKPTSTISAASSKYGSLTLRFSTIGTYDDFVQFLTSLQSSLRVVDLVSLTLSPTSVAGAAPSAPLYSYDITLRTYWLQ